MRRRRPAVAEASPDDEVKRAALRGLARRAWLGPLRFAVAGCDFEMLSCCGSTSSERTLNERGQGYGMGAALLCGGVSRNKAVLLGQSSLCAPPPTHPAAGSPTGLSPPPCHHHTSSSSLRHPRAPLHFVWAGKRTNGLRTDVWMDVSHFFLRVCAHSVHEHAFSSLLLCV